MEVQKIVKKWYEIERLEKLLEIIKSRSNSTAAEIKYYENKIKLLRGY